MNPAVMTAAELGRLRHTSIRRLFIGAGLGSVPFFAAVSASPVAVFGISGSQMLSGVSVAALSVGTGIGAAVFGQLMARRGRRAGLVAAYLMAAVGALFSVGGTAWGSVWLLIGGLLLFGAGHSANNLARYAAGELATAEHRGAAVGLVVWAATIGAVIGPNVLTPAGEVAETFGLDPLVGTYLLGMVLFAAVALFYFTRLRPEPSTIAVEDLGALPESGRRVSQLLTSFRVQIAALAMALSQFVMVLVMSVTPVHITSSGHGLGVVGVVLSSHFVGMYALSPLSGWIADRFGKMRAIWAGFGVLMLSVVAVAVTQSGGGMILAGPMFLVGFGWSLSFVAGSALVSEGLAYADRARLQGAVDTMVWSCSALAAALGGVLLGVFGYPSLSLLAGAVVLAGALVLLIRYRGRLPA
ncbi:MAG: MFS transporter [Actinobacteria bacterium]|nr:MFS transporter [Actinomycetota bacterium]